MKLPPKTVASSLYGLQKNTGERTWKVSTRSRTTWRPFPCARLRAGPPEHKERQPAHGPGSVWGPGQGPRASWGPASSRATRPRPLTSSRGGDGRILTCSRSRGGGDGARLAPVTPAPTCGPPSSHASRARLPGPWVTVCGREEGRRIWQHGLPQAAPQVIVSTLYWKTQRSVGYTS